MKPESWLETLNCAVEGILRAVKSQRHMRWHILVCLGVLVLAPRFPITPAEFALLCLATGIVIVGELLNTALESVVDLASPGFHPLARAAKDVAAGAVLVAAFAAVAVGWVIFFPKLGITAAQTVEELNRHEPIGIASFLLAILVVVILVKAAVGRGSPLHGGFPSGHAAVAFAIATLLTLRAKDPAVAFLSFLLALMVSHSRLLLRVHTRLEVAAGAGVGLLAAAILYWVLF